MMNGGQILANVSGISIRFEPTDSGNRIFGLSFTQALATTGRCIDSTYFLKMSIKHFFTFRTYSVAEFMFRMIHQIFTFKLTISRI